MAASLSTGYRHLADMESIKPPVPSRQRTAVMLPTADGVTLARTR
ncbi:hypothetical protein [Micromonospora aurantiaca]|nr:hypothetical protein [Micromonospora aurantiaca]